MGSSQVLQLPQFFHPAHGGTPAATTASARHRHGPHAPAQAQRVPARVSVSWARHLDEVREAQRLRHAVFVGEMGARLVERVPGHDVDLFDDYCEHLLVRDPDSGEVVGTYRLLTPAQAARMGCTYTDTEFDLRRLRHLRERMVELGRSCVHADYRQGGVVLALWGALGEFMARNGLDTMIGCASIPLHCESSQGTVLGGHAAASIWHQLPARHLAPEALRALPRLPLPVESLRKDLPVQPPALIQAYLRMGAKVLGAPAWDPEFNTADLPMLICLQDLPTRYRKHFLQEA